MAENNITNDMQSETDTESEPVEMTGVCDTAPDRGVKIRYRNIVLSLVVVYIYNLSILVHEHTIDQYLYKRVSREIFGNLTTNSTGGSICYVNTSEPGYRLEQEAQSRASQKQMYYTLTSTCIGFVSLLLIAAYADRVPRKTLYLLPMIGTFCKNLPLVFIIYWDLNFDFFYIGEIIQGLLGTAFCSGIAQHSYLADNTPPKKSRTIALAFSEAVSFLVIASGNAASGYFIRSTGFFYPELTSCLLDLVAMAVVVFFLQETLPWKSLRLMSCSTPIQGIKKVFGFYLLEGTRRKRVLYSLGFMSLFLIQVSALGISNTKSLFMLNQPFCWTPDKIGIYNMVFGGVKQGIGLPLIKFLQYCVPDAVIAVLGGLSILASHVLEAFASTDWMMYGAAAAGAFSMAVKPTINAILSRMTSAERQGSLFAGLAFLSIVTLAIGTPLFSSIYQQTVGFFRGGAFLAMAGVDLLAVLAFMLFAWLSSRSGEA